MRGISPQHVIMDHVVLGSAAELSFGIITCCMASCVIFDVPLQCWVNVVTHFHRRALYHGFACTIFCHATLTVCSSLYCLPCVLNVLDSRAGASRVVRCATNKICGGAYNLSCLSGTLAGWKASGDSIRARDSGQSLLHHGWLKTAGMCVLRFSCCVQLMQ